jgi:hypothetical protein
VTQLATNKTSFLRQRSVVWVRQLCLAPEIPGQWRVARPYQQQRRASSSGSRFLLRCVLACVSPAAVGHPSTAIFSTTLINDTTYVYVRAAPLLLGSLRERWMDRPNELLKSCASLSGRAQVHNTRRRRPRTKKKLLHLHKPIDALSLYR